MVLPGNGLYIVKGELSTVLTALRKSYASPDAQQNDSQKNLKILITAFEKLTETLDEINDLKSVKSGIYLSPFLKVICSKNTTSPVISLALVSITKFLSYDILDPKDDSISITVQNIADAVKKAQFVAQNSSSNIVAKGKVLHLFSTLVLGPQGAYLTNESLEGLTSFSLWIFHSLNDSEHLRKIMEYCLMAVVQFLFTRLSHFTDVSSDKNMRYLKMKQNIDKKNCVASTNKIFAAEDTQMDSKGEFFEYFGQFFIVGIIL